MIKIINPDYPFTKSAGDNAFADLMVGVVVLAGIIAIISMGFARLLKEQDKFTHTETENAR